MDYEPDSNGVEPGVGTWGAVEEEIKRRVQNTWSVIHWHTRAFFWELSAMFDTMLQWANARYELGASKHQDFKWRNDKEKKGLFYNSPNKDASDWYIRQAIIDGIWKSNWFQEIRDFRNHSHEGFLNQIAEYQVENGKFKTVKFSRVSLRTVGNMKPQYALDLSAQLTDYLTKMGAEAKRVFG